MTVALNKVLSQVVPRTCDEYVHKPSLKAFTYFGMPSGSYDL